jgi:micrococcal nuclease
MEGVGRRMDKGVRMYKYKAKLVRVVDGDTVDCILDLGFDVSIKERVRLKGLDTPEIRTKDLHEKELGFKAKKFVEDMFQDKGNDVIIETEYRRGKYGRTIGTITFQDDTVLNEMLITEGHAVKVNY